MHAISNYRGNTPTNKLTQPQIHRQDRLQYTAPQLARSVCVSPERFFFILIAEYFYNIFITIAKRANGSFLQILLF